MWESVQLFPNVTRVKVFRSARENQFQAKTPEHQRTNLLQRLSEPSSCSTENYGHRALFTICANMGQQSLQNFGNHLLNPLFFAHAVSAQLRAIPKGVTSSGFTGRATGRPVSASMTASIPGKQLVPPTRYNVSTEYPWRCCFTMLAIF